MTGGISMRFTVFTPTYNRGPLLRDLYESLCRQTFRDFEWVIVDDGSSDNTEEIVQDFKQKEHFFPIIYKKIPNGGKHRAWNRGVDLASGELFFGCDSDDYLTDDALEITDRMEKSIPSDEKARFAGVCGLKAYKNTEVVGSTFSESDWMDLTHLERIENHVTGDKSEVIYTAVWKRYKYHEFEGEKFLTESTALNRMAADGLKMRYFNAVVKIIEYLPDGLSAGSMDHFYRNPKGWGLYIHQQIKYGLLRGIKKWETITNYNDHCNAEIGLKEVARNLRMHPLQVKLVAFLTDRYWRLSK